MKVEIWSDLGCPWCYIGEEHFRTALAEFEHRDQVEVIYRSFERDPEAPAERGELAALFAHSRFGKERTQQIGRQVEAAAAASGLDFVLEGQMRYNTIDAHRLMHMALDPAAGGSVQRQHELNRVMSQRHFTEGADFADHDQLADAATSIGMDRNEVQKMLASERYSANVVSDIREGLALGVNAVPFFVVNRRYAASGAQDSSALRELLQQAWQHQETGT